MNTKYNKFFYPVALFAAMVSCTTNEVDNSLELPAGAITFLAEMTTRATDTAFEEGDKISVTALSVDKEVYKSNVEYTYSDNIFTSDSPITYGDGNEELSFRVLYPYAEMADDRTVSFSVETDQSVGANYTLSDLMISYASQTSSQTPTLVFDHFMSKIVINLTSEGVEMVDVSVSLNAVAGVKYCLETLSSEVIGEATTITMCGNGVNSYKAILAPQTVSANTTFGVISVDGVDYEISLVTGLSLKGGRQYTIDATLKEDGSIVFDSPMINGWDDGALDEDAIDGAAYFTLADFDGMTTLPEESIWVITDESATSSDFSALRSAFNLATLERQIELVFSNLIELPSEVLSSGNLVSISLPKATIIGDKAFQYCYSLTSLSIPSATSIGSLAFLRCSTLADADLDIEVNEEYFIFEDLVLYDADKTTIIFVAPTKTGEYVAPSTVTAVNTYAFSFCSNINFVTISFLCWIVDICILYLA